jgi:hypothetical protein
MKKYYIVQELGSEYNDEIYVLSEEGKPNRVFTDRESADRYCEDLSVKKLSGEEIGQYGYGLDEIIKDIEGFVEVYNEVFGKNLKERDLEDSYEFALPEMTKAQYDKIKGFLKIKFYEVIECEGE